MNKKIFISCDTNKVSIAQKIIKHSNTNKLKIGYKFGLEFINSKNGRAFISKLKNKIIFIDIKLHDIPNTCVSALRAIKDLKADYLTIHISSGFKALRATKKASNKTKIVGVTTLTSIDSHSLKQIGYDKKIRKLVYHQAKLAKKANLDAIVCSAQEAKNVKKIFKKQIITPGIRFNSNNNDQKRVMSPKEAFKNGSDWLVMGRPITKGNIKKNIQKLIDHLNK
tara:strand:- start:155 stop:826 length:672 start_codon:yes stop_codon:yes gene_type:complete